jgi:hypothetical protein
MTLVEAVNWKTSTTQNPYLDIGENSPKYEESRFASTDSVFRKPRKATGQEIE